MLQNTAKLLVTLIIITITNCSPLNFKNVKMHTNCQNITFCFDRVDDYPETLIESLVDKTELTNIDGATTEHRGTFDNSIVTPCDSEDSIRPIYQVVDVNDKVRYVVQVSRFQQIFRVEWCKNKGEITQFDSDYLKVDKLWQEQYKAYCVEHYTNYKFLVLREDGNGLESVKVKQVPICCRCEIHPMDKIIL